MKSMGRHVSWPFRRKRRIYPVDLCTEVRFAVITYDNCVDQLFCSSFTHLASILWKIRFIRSMTALEWGVKSVIRVFGFSRDCMSSLKSSDSKFRPWTLRMLNGHPKRQIQCRSNALAVVGAVWSGSGTA